MSVMPARQQDGAPPFTGAILAGGFSRRLGQDKAALPLGGKPLALWVNQALAPLVASCWLITNQPLAHL
jgi:molybdopterin-guanine dinucleotide biosynthesis protein A